MASAFSTSDTAILTAPIELDPLLQAATSAAQSIDIRTLYDIERTASTILQHGFRSIALQFPDEALIDSVPVYWALRDELSAKLKVQKRSDQSEEQRAGPSSQGAGRKNTATAMEEDALPELYILADTSYGNCCVDEVAAAHVDADLVVHYGHTCLSPTANLPALYVFPQLPVDVTHAAQSLASFVLDKVKSEASGSKTLVLTYDVAYAHASEAVLGGLRNSTELKEAGWEVFSMEVDTRRSFQDQVRKRTVRGVQKSTCAGATDGACCNTAPGDRGQTCSGCQDGGCMQSSKPSTASAFESTEYTESQVASLALDDSNNTDGNTPQEAAKQEFDRIPLTSGRSVNVPRGRTFEASSSTVLYLGPESRALTNLLLHLGPSFPVVSYDPTRYQPDAPSSSSAAAPVRLETGKTNRLLMQRYAMVQRARDASVVGLLVGTLGVASYLPLLDRLRARLTGSSNTGNAKTAKKNSTKGSGGRKVYTVSIGKLNPAKLANFQEIEVWVLIACPENSLVGSKSGLGSSGAGGSGGLSGANGHGGDFWRPIVTPFEMELALGPEGVWTGEYEVDLAKLADKLEKTSDAPVGRSDEDAENGDTDDEDDEDDDEDRPHYSFVTGTYVSRTKYRDTAADDEDDAPGKPGTTVALRAGQEVSVIQSASGLTHIGGRLTEREWGGLTRPEGVDRYVPSVLEVGRTGIAGGYAHAGGDAEGGHQ
ncbi:unnamed protein product [Tilletia laevis]|uniref:2-(3-amino-3-carboxypropyl)histidine synthase n=2 Tax=Tilletia TaxID=13289 RepID=A0A177VGQ2_9BASI|nr:hypothetical protein CF336_g3114 [Tilletia laevis]KAE8262493.1 hypothetical protein A4X03_0g2409 [Tilletia caries]KAE8205243.1 hypothetical protein CF335_g2367 [Tilletia laevis]CAD6892881.1 unnamed protein product [Tilletia caries]CAD6916955.1 unnamed protein product [Tilletia caries]